jgi:outer membrane protein OmpA-like peptidoglycan-associated protein
MKKNSSIAIARSLVFVLLALVALSPQAVQAAPLGPFELDRPVLNPGASRFLSVGGGQLREPGLLRLGLYGQYQHDPLVVYRGDDALRDVVQSRWAMGLFAAYAFGPRLELALHLPFVLSQSGQDASALGITSPDSSGLAAPVLGARLGVLSERLSHPFDLSLDVAVALPVGNKDALASDDGVGARVGLGIGKRWGGFDLGGDAGIWLRPRTDVGVSRTSGQQILLAAGMGYTTEAAVRFEVTGLGGVGLSELGNAFELLGGLRIPAGVMEVFALGGPGFGQTAGTPAFRVLLGLAYAPRKKAPPVEDPCARPKAPVSTCPMADWDGDGIANKDDVCPTHPEDRDQFEDTDGCPDPDNDDDKILDVEDSCPLVPGEERFAGCPPPDADKDGVLDPDDACPQEPGPVERKGCPARDTDGDGVLDEVDSCVNEPGPAENQGCPEQEKQLVQITKEKLVILDKVYFDTNKATIKAVSFPLLDQVARVLMEHPEVARVRVEGHTDSRGKDQKNMVLSQGRADSVRTYLIGKGVADDRLTAVGFGETQPIEPNSTTSGRAKNRRVEFIIVSEGTP